MVMATKGQNRAVARAKLNTLLTTRTRGNMVAQATRMPAARMFSEPLPFRARREKFTVTAVEDASPPKSPVAMMRRRVPISFVAK